MKIKKVSAVVKSYIQLIIIGKGDKLDYHYPLVLMADGAKRDHEKAVIPKEADAFFYFDEIEFTAKVYYADSNTRGVVTDTTRRLNVSKTYYPGSKRMTVENYREKIHSCDWGIHDVRTHVILTRNGTPVKCRPTE